jgi:hypothetical protein
MATLNIRRYKNAVVLDPPDVFEDWVEQHKDRELLLNALDLELALEIENLMYDPEKKYEKHKLLNKAEMQRKKLSRIN